MAEAAVAALGITDGPSYTQLRIGPDGPQVIEVAARLGGGHDAELVEARHGRRPQRARDRRRARRAVAGAARRSALVGGAVTRFLVAPPGVLEAVEVPEGLAGVERVRIYRGPGAVFGRCGAAPTARAPCSRPAPSRDAGACARADAAAERIRFVTADAGVLVRRPLATHWRPSPRTFLSFQPPAITEEEIDAVAETLRSGWLTTGPRTAELEARMREYLEAKHVLAVSSCTAALHLSLVALGVGPGDEVITTSITWPATANVIVHCGATPVFADVRDDTLNIDPERVRELVTEQHQGDRAGRPLRPARRPRSARWRSASRSSRTPRTPPSRATAAARSARSPT